jgi:hypothetical protein
VFSVSPSLAGGVANCPSCGRATAVPGLDDPLWRVLQVGAVLLWIGATSFAWSAAGAVVGLAVGVGLGALLWLLSRAF